MYGAYGRAAESAVSAWGVAHRGVNAGLGQVRTVGQQRAQDAFLVGSAAITGATTVAPTVTALLVAAGVGGAAGPPGWIVSVGAATAAGTIALVGAIRSGKTRRRDAVALAQQLGIPDAAEAPAFITRLFKMSSAARQNLGSKLERKLARPGPFTNVAKIRHKLSLVGTVDVVEKAAAQGNIPPGASAGTMEQKYAGPFAPGTPGRMVLLIGTGGLLTLAAAVILLGQKR